jgi:hypothetical protein
MYVVKYKRRNGGLTHEWSRRAAWTDVEVGLTGRTGGIDQVKVKRPTASEPPVCYIVTSTGQIWRGSSDVGWEKVVELPFTKLKMSMDFNNENRIVVIDSSEIAWLGGRVFELVRQSPGSWTSTKIDQPPAGVLFTPDLHSP